jgi:hypothetical protein
MTSYPSQSAITEMSALHRVMRWQCVSIDASSLEESAQRSSTAAAAHSSLGRTVKRLKRAANTDSLDQEPQLDVAACLRQNV